ncbi:hypothetical protein RE6C_00862 [Rhodopirellula europaea 6C]|uniref:Uncharacterized protein n=1 Tax=Rhodopirellula europaea 6C TaxID=1263867 RepID=M2A8S4_9BACT|nr:hypothetical protein RE6C_00862 [Rhodopirellula europaea 6C]
MSIISVGPNFPAKILKFRSSSLFHEPGQTCDKSVPGEQGTLLTGLFFLFRFTQDASDASVDIFGDRHQCHRIAFDRIDHVDGQ